MLPHKDGDFNHICDNEWGEKNIGAHRDENKDHVCDYGCTEPLGEHSDGEDDDIFLLGKDTFFAIDLVWLFWYNIEKLIKKI